MKSRDVDFERLLEGNYREMAFESAAQVGRVLTLISDEKNLPALVHCTVGKDRTGFISAVVQLFVGVPRESVLDDYLATNRLLEPSKEKLERMLRRMTLFRISEDRLAPLLEARRHYLEEVLDEILKRYATIEEYLREACGVSRDRLRDLERLLLV